MVQDLIPESTDEDDRLILTAAHLLDDVPDGTRILCAPAGPEPSSADGRFCGTVRRRVPLSHLPSIVVDAAVVKPHPSIACSSHMDCGAPNGLRDLWVAEDESEVVAVRKHGAQTGMTSGQLMPIPADHYMEDVRARYAKGWWAYGSDGAAFAAKGDSGAIVVDEARRVVGMVVAIDHDGPDAAAFVHGIKQVFAALQIALP
ncbi:MAG: hypothetical protein ACRDLF_06555 [Solirubrobacteraceae bacterium]